MRKLKCYKTFEIVNYCRVSTIYANLHPLKVQSKAAQHSTQPRKVATGEENCAMENVKFNIIV